MHTIDTEEDDLARTFAYCRVSTTDQTAENQIVEIETAGFGIEAHRIVAETVSGSTPAFSRTGFAKLVDRLEMGDVLIVTKLDRLGRNAMDVRSTVERLASAGVRVHCLALGGTDLASAAGKMTMSVIAAVAEFEKDLLVERTRSGLARAKAQGKRLGRRQALSDLDQRDIRAARASGTSLGELAKRYDVSRSMIQRVEARASRAHAT
ncbi:recombinase family protein [Novosphingobium sp. PhB55]|uniref:recombinase family protein n=1 Tax=Novosphingobium sp. PhB55 TaxID=2485106 RepID=UPI001FB97E2E|nr:recombinase family protein [Novosphingobium sp. PhB55]